MDTQGRADALLVIRRVKKYVCCIKPCATRMAAYLRSYDHSTEKLKIYVRNAPQCPFNVLTIPLRHRQVPSRFYASFSTLDHTFARDAGVDPGSASGPSILVAPARRSPRVGPANERNQHIYGLLGKAAVRAAEPICPLACTLAYVPVCDPRDPAVGARDPSEVAALLTMCVVAGS